MYSLFDYAFGPTKVIVVSEERLQAAERRAKEEQIEAVEAAPSQIRRMIPLAWTSPVDPS